MKTFERHCYCKRNNYYFPYLILIDSSPINETIWDLVICHSSESSKNQEQNLRLPPISENLICFVINADFVISKVSG